MAPRSLTACHARLVFSFGGGLKLDMRSKVEPIWDTFRVQVGEWPEPAMNLRLLEARCFMEEIWFELPLRRRNPPKDGQSELFFQNFTGMNIYTICMPLPVLVWAILTVSAFYNEIAGWAHLRVTII